MYMIRFNYIATLRIPIPSGSSININTKSFDTMVQDRKEQSVKVAMEELSMEGEGDKPFPKKRKVRESDVTLIRSPYVKVVVDNKEINMLWANNSSVLWMEMTEPRFLFLSLVYTVSETYRVWACGILE